MPACHTLLPMLLLLYGVLSPDNSISISLHLAFHHHATCTTTCTGHAGMPHQAGWKAGSGHFPPPGKGTWGNLPSFLLPSLTSPGGEPGEPACLQPACSLFPGRGNLASLRGGLPSISLHPIRTFGARRSVMPVIIINYSVLIIIILVFFFLFWTAAEQPTQQLFINMNGGRFYVFTNADTSNVLFLAGTYMVLFPSALPFRNYSVRDGSQRNTILLACISLLLSPCRTARLERDALFVRFCVAPARARRYPRLHNLLNQPVTRRRFDACSFARCLRFFWLYYSPRACLNMHSGDGVCLDTDVACGVGQANVQ